MSEEIKRCGCGGPASFEVVEIDPNIPIEHQPNYGGQFIACRKCGMSTVLVFNTKGDDPRPILREKWNASMRSRAPSPDHAALQADADNWMKGVAFINAALGERACKDISCTRIGEAVLALRAEVEAIKDVARWHIAVDGLNGSACWCAREFVDVRKRLIELVGPLISHDDAIARIRAGLESRT